MFGVEERGAFWQPRHEEARDAQFDQRISALGHRGTWLPVADFAAASRAVRELIEANDIGGSTWRGGRVVDAGTKKHVANVSYNGRVWLPDGTEAPLDATS